MSDTNQLMPTTANPLQQAAPAPAPMPTGAAPMAPAAPPGPPVDAISPRLPVPKADFHPDEHDTLHRETGPAFDKPDAAKFLREAYDAARAAHPNASPRTVLGAARDAWHAVNHGFMSREQAHPALSAHLRSTTR